MPVLIAVASKHGATREIAEEIAGGLRRRGVPADVRAAEEVRAVTGYDAVVLGSAVYAGHWLRPARRLAAAHAEALARRPVWLFSSGPLGDPPMPEDEAVDIGGILRATDALGHTVFGGRLDRARLSFAERAIAHALHAPEGDFRDWSAVEAFADAVAERLGGDQPHAPPADPRAVRHPTPS